MGAHLGPTPGAADVKLDTYPDDHETMAVPMVRGFSPVQFFDQWRSGSATRQYVRFNADLFQGCGAYLI